MIFKEKKDFTLFSLFSFLPQSKNILAQRLQALYGPPMAQPAYGMPADTPVPIIQSILSNIFVSFIFIAILLVGVTVIILRKIKKSDKKYPENR